MEIHIISIHVFFLHVFSRDCPNEVNEAVSTLVFSAAWLGNLPELQTIRKLFGEDYGHIFTKPSADLYPGSLVNQELGDCH